MQIETADFAEAGKPSEPPKARLTIALFISIPTKKAVRCATERVAGAATPIAAAVPFGRTCAARDVTS